METHSRKHSFLSRWRKTHTKCFDLEWSHLKRERVPLTGDLVERFLQQITLLGGQQRCQKGERATPALIMRFVQPHDQTIPILRWFHRLHDNVRAICLDKGSAGSVRCRYARASCRLLLTSHAHHRHIEFVGPPHTLRFPPRSCMRE